MKVPQAPRKARRSRGRCLVAVVAIVAAGLASRSESLGLNTITGDYPGDVLWATLVYVLVAFVRPRWPSHKVAISAAAVALSVELSQLYHAPWLDDIRRTTLGGLVLGYGFLWSDLVCYAIGIVLGVVLDRLLWTATSSRRDA